MPFDARCPYCRLKVKKVPDQRLGGSMECVRCHNTFVLEPMEGSQPQPAATSTGVAPGKPPLTVAALVKEIPKDQPAPAGAAAVPPSERRPPNYPGLASFVLACFAVCAGTALQTGMITFALGILALLLGIAGLVFPIPKKSRPVLPAAGLAVSLPAVLVAVFLPRWAGLSPIWERSRPSDRQGEAVIALSGRGGARRAAKGETVWVDASNDALLHGDVRLRVRSAVVGPAEFESAAGQKPPQEPCLVIALRITNAGIDRKLPYTRWGGTPGTREGPQLRDNNGKVYPEKTFSPGWTVKGTTAQATLSAGKWIDDVLVFEAPPATIEHLRLELPGAAVGAEGRLHVEIPKKMIVFR
jgi:hypothetical protein